MSSSAALKAQKRQKFERVYEVIREELLAHFNGEGMPKEAAEWYRQVRTTSCNHIHLRLDHVLDSTPTPHSILCEM